MYVGSGQYQQAQAGVCVGCAGLGAYTTAPPAGSIMNIGTSGTEVEEWQRFLNAVAARFGRGHPVLDVDGVYGGRTGLAVKTLQYRVGVKPTDGILGPATVAAVNVWLATLSPPLEAAPGDEGLTEGSTGAGLPSWALPVAGGVVGVVIIGWLVLRKKT